MPTNEQVLTLLLLEFGFGGETITRVSPKYSVS